MFFYSSQNKPTIKLTFEKFSDSTKDRDAVLNQISKWSEDKWGYLRQFPGYDARKKLITAPGNDLYLAKMGSQVVGMFVLKNDPLDKAFGDHANQKIKKLYYFYVHPSLRGFGLGNQMLDEAKAIAAKEKATIKLDTLTPDLNYFYMKGGAKVLCEMQALGAPAELLKIKYTNRSM